MSLRIRRLHSPQPPILTTPDLRTLKPSSASQILLKGVDANVIIGIETRLRVTVILTLHQNEKTVVQTRNLPLSLIG